MNIGKLGLVISMMIATVGVAQNGPINVPPGAPAGVIDGVVMQQHIPTKKVIPYAFLREADYVWSKRVWRVIDLREKINFPLYYPLEPMNDRWCLWDILKSGLKSKAIIGYLPFDNERKILGFADDGDQFRYPVLPPNLGGTPKDYKEGMQRMTSICTPYDSFPPAIGTDPNTGLPIYDPKDVDGFGNPLTYQAYDCKNIDAQDITAYHIKEDWFFDKQRSVLDVRIIGLAPMSKGDEGFQELFWVYFPEARYLLQNYFTYNEKNDARRMSFDDLFWKRKFASFIDKETNVYDREINDHKVGVDALLKSEEIKKDIFTFEHDVWHF